MLTVAEIDCFKALLRNGPMPEGNLPYAGPQGLCDRGWAIREDDGRLRLSRDGLEVAEHIGLGRDEERGSRG